MALGRMRTLVIGIPVSIVTAAVVWAATASTAESTEVPVPPWVNADGSTDESKMPERIGIAGPDGEPLLDAVGNPVTISTEGFDAPPPPGPGTLLGEDDLLRNILDPVTEVINQVLTIADPGPPQPDSQ